MICTLPVSLHLLACVRSLENKTDGDHLSVSAGATNRGRFSSFSAWALSRPKKKKKNLGSFPKPKAEASSSCLCPRASWPSRRRAALLLAWLPDDSLQRPLPAVVTGRVNPFSWMDGFGPARAQVNVNCQLSRQALALAKDLNEHTAWLIDT